MEYTGNSLIMPCAPRLAQKMPKDFDDEAGMWLRSLRRKRNGKSSR
jgi:hypothetical protein